MVTITEHNEYCELYKGDQLIGVITSYKSYLETKLQIAE